MDQKKFPLVVFSGGVDSTYMLHAALVKGDVHTLYIEGRQGEEKSKAEQASRKRIIRYLDELHEKGDLKGRILCDTIVEIGISGKRRSFFNKDLAEDYKNWDVCYQSRRVAFNQPLFWLTGINWVIDPDIHSEIQIGYIAGDQIVYHLRDMEEAWVRLMSFTHMEIVSLDFPLKFFNKKKIFKYIEPELLKMTWVCELPKVNEESKTIDECGRCDKCLEKMDMMKIVHNRDDALIKIQEPEENDNKNQKSYRGDNHTPEGSGKCEPVPECCPNDQ